MQFNGFLQRLGRAAFMVMALMAAPAWAQDNVVYHISDTNGQALQALRNLRNHLDADPQAHIVVVALGDGIDFLREGAKDHNGSAYAGPVSALTN